MGKAISSFKKRVLLTSLFIVPFLIGMALIFMGKGLGTLPFLYPESEGSKSYYTVPEFQAKSLLADSVFEFSHSDSSIYVVTFFPKEVNKEWDKHIVYIAKIFERYNNTKVLSIFEEEGSKDWKENPRSFFKRYEKWQPVTVNQDQFNSLLATFKVVPDSAYGFPPYVIVDKEKHIRANCPINDLKKVRDIPKMLKILNNQYAPRKIEISKRSDSF